jgi:hypothetical protein
VLGPGDILARLRELRRLGSARGCVRRAQHWKGEIGEGDEARLVADGACASRISFSQRMHEPIAIGVGMAVDHEESVSTLISAPSRN